MAKYQKPKGTNDFFPLDMAVRTGIFNSLRSTAQRYGYSEVESPAFESMSVLTAKSGDEIKNQIFTLDKRGKEEFGLRFDLTIPMTRMFVSKQGELAKPVKWFCLSRMWRYERPQKGREREFYQLSVEVFGCDKPTVDAELISMAIDMLKNLGLTKKDFIVRVNSRKLLQGLLDLSRDKAEQVIRIIDKKQKVNEADFKTMLKEVGGDPKKILPILNAKTLSALKKFKMNALAKEGFEELQTVVGLLDPDFVEISLSTARGLAYYTGIVFEIFDREGELRSIAGGGRYGSLVELLGGQPSSSTGFAIGYSTLSLLLQQKEKLPALKFGVDYFIATAGDGLENQAMKIAQQLRKRFSVSMDLTGRKLSKQLEYANTIGARKVVIVGATELKKREVKVKIMSSGRERLVKISTFQVNKKGNT